MGRSYALAAAKGSYDFGSGFQTAVREAKCRRVTNAFHLKHLVQFGLGRHLRQGPFQHNKEWRGRRLGVTVQQQFGETGILIGLCGRFDSATKTAMNHRSITRVLW